MPIDPQARMLLDQMEALGVGGLHEMPLADARAMIAGVAMFAGDPEPVASVEEREIPSDAGPVRVRVYRPEAGGPLPVVVSFHGGGWALGDLEIDDVVCRALANATPALVVNVDYPLAPEQPYPAPLDGCSGVVRWLQDHAAELGGDGTRIAVVGESSGGNLAATAAIRLRDEGRPPLALQVLIYPALDSTMSTASYAEFEDGYFLTKGLMDWAWHQYAKTELENPWVSPMHATRLTGLPPALVITAEYDPLRDEGRAYAERLRAEGIDATITQYPGMIHGFYGMGGVFPAAKEAIAETVARLQQAFAPS